MAETCQHDYIHAINGSRMVFTIKEKDFKEMESIEYQTLRFKTRYGLLFYIRFTIVPEELLNADINSDLVSNALTNGSDECKNLPGIRIYMSPPKGYNVEKKDTIQITSSILTKQELGVIAFQTNLYEGVCKYEKFFNWDDLLRVAKETGTVRICFDIMHFKDDSNMQNNISIVDDDCSKMIKSLNLFSFMETGEHTDFIIKSHGKEFKAHKIVLAAASPTFARMLSNKMKESLTGEVTMPDEYKAEVVKEMLNYMYTNSADNLAQMPYELYELAHLYCINSLVKLCKNHLLNNITVENVIQTLKLSEKYSLNDLREKALLFIKSNEPKIVKQDEYIVYLLENIRVDKVAHYLILVRKYELLDLHNPLLEFIVKNFKEVMQDKNYRYLYISGNVNLVIQVDEYISNKCLHLQD